MQKYINQHIKMPLHHSSKVLNITCSRSYIFPFKIFLVLPTSAPAGESRPGPYNCTSSAELCTSCTRACQANVQVCTSIRMTNYKVSYSNLNVCFTITNTQHVFIDYQMKCFILCDYKYCIMIKSIKRLL